MRGLLRFYEALLAGIYVFHLSFKLFNLEFHHHKNQKDKRGG